MSSQRAIYNIIKNKNIQSSTIDKIIDFVYFENFHEILLKDKSNFLNNIESRILEMLKLYNKGNELNYNSDLSLYKNKRNNLISRYESDFSLLNSQYEKYKSHPNKFLFLTKYRKHCINSDKIPLHKCTINDNIFGKFIEVINTNEKKSKNVINNDNYVICTECRFCFPISFIKIWCSDCKSEFFSAKLDNGEDENILPATWKEYHCTPILSNEKMKCIKCNNILYINLISNKLVCLNKKCNFIANPRSIIWKCKICKKDFRSLAKVYNPLESKILQNEIWKSLIYKEKAIPKKEICCLKNDKDEKIKYYHDKMCKGELYKANLNGNDIIVCGKCHAVNFFDKFIWTCPKCNKKISNHKEHQEQKINNNNIKIKNNLKTLKENKSTMNIGELNISKEKTNKKLFSKNQLMFQYYFTQRKNNKDNTNTRINKIDKTIEKLKKDLSVQLISNNSNENKQTQEKNNIIKNNHFKKRNKYKTLLDILEEREKYKLDNKSIEGIKDEQEFQETIKQDKTKLDIKYTKRKEKLLEEGKPKTSRKNYRKIFFQQYLSPPNTSYAKNTNNNNRVLDSKQNNEQILRINLFNKSPKYIVKSTDDENDNKNDKENLYKDFLYSKIYKDEHSTTTNDENEKIEIMKKLKRNQKNHKLIFEHKKKYLKEPDNLDDIDIAPRKKCVKKLFKENEDLKKEDKEDNIIKVLNNNEIKNESKLDNFTKNKNNQECKRIYLGKLNAQNRSKIARSRDSIKNRILEEKSKPKIEFSQSINEINNKSEIKISPFGDLNNNNFISKDDFLNISKDFEISPFKENEIHYINSIGISSNGIIYLVEDKLAKKQYALKRLICQDLAQILKIKKEFKLCHNLNHQNIIKIYNIFFKYIDSTTYLLYILMEKAESDWESQIEKKAESKNYYTENELIDILKQLVNAFLFLQNKGIAHRNIKPKNILICENNIYKITDLIEAKQNNNTKKELSTLKGNQLYMAPHLYSVLKNDGNELKVNHNIFKSDVFSLGFCFLYAMSLDIKLIKKIREENCMDNIISSINKYDINNRYSEKLMNIIYKMIQIDESKRCDFIELNEEIKNNF